MQIWNNAVFDDGGGFAAKASPAWCAAFRPLSAIPAPAESLTPAAGKENRSPGFPSLAGGALPLSAATPQNKSTIGVGGAGAGRSIDEEIEEVEKEIERLQARLLELRLKKTERDSRSASRRGRIVPSKFLDLKPSPAKKSEAVGSPAGSGFRRRSASLGPLEICAATIGLRREEAPLPQPPNLTPLRSAQSKRKSCLQKLQDIAEDEGEVEKKVPFGSIAEESALTTANSLAAPTGEEFRRRKGVSLGPSEISAASSALRREEIKEARCLGREGGRRKEIQPKMLFHETKKPFKREAAASLPPPPMREPKKSAPPPAKRTSKTPKVRTVSSRYSLITVKVGRNPPEGKRRKWSLPAAAAPAADTSLPWVGPEMIDEESTLTKVNAESPGRAGRIGQPASSAPSEQDLMDLEEDEEQQ